MKDFKKQIKKATPEVVKHFYRQLVATRERIVAFSYDRRRFLKYNAKRSIGRNSRAQLDARMTFHAHAIEKGLSHQVIRLGFGKKALGMLIKNMNTYTQLAFPVDGTAYQNALSVLREYIVLHENNDLAIDYLESICSKSLLEEANSNDSGLGGIEVIKSTNKHDNRKLNFKQLFENRWSVREYPDVSVDKNLIGEVLEIARKTPSICNRQSSRATVIYSQDKIKEVLNLQGGITGYKLPPVLIMITTDTSAFVGVNERNQVFIDGGLYAMSVLLGLEHVSLAACPLNAMLTVKNDKKMRRILNIPASENIIMFISVGHFMTDNKVPKSFRYNSDETSRSVS